MNRPSFLLAIALLPLLAWSSDLPSVTVTPPTPPAITHFDPANPPSDLPKGEDADTNSLAEVSGGNYDYARDGKGNITVTSVGNVTTELSTSVRLPSDAGQPLEDHENGHVALSNSDYTANATKKVENAFRGFVGTTFTGVGDTPAAREQNAFKQADAERDRRLAQASMGLKSQIATVNNKYDDLTSHGESQTVNSAEGQDMTKKELSLASAAGSSSFLPSSGPVLASGSITHLTLDPSSPLINIAPSVTSFSAASAFDPLLGTTILVDPFVFIGAQENGTSQLGDSRITISAGAQTLLQGYLVQAAYMSSSLPGFAGMIQAYLDVPPDFTGAGINNTIGSPFLTAYDAVLNGASTTGPSTFWFFTNQALFDNAGNVLNSDVTGIVEIGAAVPEPRLWGLIGILLAFALCRSPSAVTQNRPMVVT